MPQQTSQNPAPRRYLFAALHNSQHYPDTSEQGLFVFDIENGHELVERFPAVPLGPHRAGWSGLAAHAPRGILVHVDDADAIRCYDVIEKRLLWERYRVTETDQKLAAEHPRTNLFLRSFSWIDRRFGTTRDGKYLLIPDRDSAKTGSLEEPVVRLLDADTGEWVRNIALVDPTGEDETSRGGSPHNVQIMPRNIYASKWNDGHIYVIDPESLEVTRRLGPVRRLKKSEDSGKSLSEGERLGTETAHEDRSIQHFSVSPDEKYVYAEPVKDFGLGIIDVASGEYLGRWDIPLEQPGTVFEKRRQTPQAEGNQLHSKANHGIAARPDSTEVWMTDDRWGMCHIWDVASLPPRYVEAVPLFDRIDEPVMDFSWLNFTIEGDYCYAFNKVIDATSRQVVKTLPGLNESSLEIQIAGDRVVRTGHEIGSGLDTWIAGYGPDG